MKDAILLTSIREENLNNDLPESLAEYSVQLIPR